MSAGSPTDRMQLVRVGTVSAGSASLADEVRAGLTAEPKSLPYRFLYDAAGSKLFEQICELPEYYLTRAETEILTAHAGAIVAGCATPTTLVELGSGSSSKTRLLI